MANNSGSLRVGTITIAGTDTFTVVEEAYPSPLGFVALTPCRVADTRASGNFSGAFGSPPLTAGIARNFPLPNASCGAPSTAAAYSLNLTVVPPAPMAYLSAWGMGEGQPFVSTLNDLSGGIVANAAIVAAGVGGAVSLYASDITDAIIDINGYFAAPSTPQALAFYPVTPCRVADTRAIGGSGLTGAFGSPQMSAHSTRSFPVPSSAAVVWEHLD